ncbi:MAG: hypothetical protein ACYDD6_12995 [Acidimicrobiales bacterium]
MDLKDLMRRASRTVGVGRAFGPSYDQGSTLVIPVAIVAGGGGGGGDEWPAPRDPVSTPGAEEPDAAGHALTAPGSGNGHLTAKRGNARSSGGAGFGGVALPLGVYVVQGERVRFVPAFDATRLVLAAIGLLRLVVQLRARRRA